MDKSVELKMSKYTPFNGVYEDCGFKIFVVKISMLDIGVISTTKLPLSKFKILFALSWLINDSSPNDVEAISTTLKKYHYSKHQ